VYDIIKAPTKKKGSGMYCFKRADDEDTYLSDYKIPDTLFKKKPFLVVLPYYPSCGDIEDFPTFIENGVMYSYDEFSDKIVRFEEVFLKFYGSFERFEYSRQFGEEVKEFVDKYSKKNNEEVNNVMNELESTMFSGVGTYSDDSLINILKKIISLNSYEINIIKENYNEKKQTECISSYIDYVLYCSLSPQKYLMYKRNHEMNYIKKATLYDYFIYKAADERYRKQIKEWKKHKKIMSKF